MRKTIFYNTNPVAVSSRLNEYMKSNFGYEIDSDLESLREAKAALEEQKRTMRSDYQNREYVENMLMLETVRALLKAHLAEKKKPDANKNGIPDYAEDGKGKNDLAKGKKKKVDESEERPYVCVHAKKGKHECKAKSSYEAAKKAASHWKMKSTAGIDAHLADKEKVAESDTPKFDTNTKKYDNSYEAPKEYKMKKEKLEEGLLAQLNALLEGDAQNAEITMAARGIVDELQDMIEKLGKIQNDQLGPLTDEMAYSHGAEQSSAFKDSVDQAIAGLLGQARSAKDTVNNAVLTLSGEAPAEDMGATDMELGGDMGADMEDDISADMDLTGGDDSAAGPVDEPLGRAKRAD